MDSGNRNPFHRLKLPPLTLDDMLDIEEKSCRCPACRMTLEEEQTYQRKHPALDKLIETLQITKLEHPGQDLKVERAKLVRVYLHMSLRFKVQERPVLVHREGNA